MTEKINFAVTISNDVPLGDYPHVSYKIPHGPTGLVGDQWLAALPGIVGTLSVTERLRRFGNDGPDLQSTTIALMETLNHMAMYNQWPPQAVFLDLLAKNMREWLGVYDVTHGVPTEGSANAQKPSATRLLG